MAKKTKEETLTQEPAIDEKTQTEKPGGFLHSITTVLLAVLIVAVVSVGVFYFMGKKNINGFADSLIVYIPNYPILKYFIPEIMPEYDPEDPMYLTDKQILDKYNEQREKIKNLNASLAEANATIELLRKGDDDKVQQETLLEQNERVLESIEAERIALEKDKKELERVILQGDKEIIAEYLQKMDKVTAEAIYADIAKEMVIDDKKKLLAEPFTKMDAQGAANMLSELYAQDTEALLDILEGMEPKNMAPILEKMDPKESAKIYSLLSDRRLNK